MSKPKKSNKSARIPQPIKVKKEKTEEDRAIHSMAFYVDDRLELVKQIFGSLKTKTITNLAPEYLKEKEMEEIQELCLNELLCLSKKRLLSIINATKCPTDTESSDEDSDVEAKEEHVSLEEISSDSEIENGGKATKKSASHSRTKKDAKKTTNQADSKDAPQGQMSVLELLELQARARAIRSQLALEPVTKIEVDSDDETKAKQNQDTTNVAKEKKSNDQSTKKSHSKRNEKPVTSSSKEKSAKSNQSKPKEITRTISTGSGTEESQVSKQKIKIKRNFRNSNQVEGTNTASIETNEKETVAGEKQKQSSASQEVKKEKRSPSPDVIPIVADPEVLSISDSSSEDEGNNAEKTNMVQKQVSAEIDEETEDGEIVESVVATEEITTVIAKEKNEVDENIETNNTNDTDKQQLAEPQSPNAVDDVDNVKNYENDENQTKQLNEELAAPMSSEIDNLPIAADKPTSIIQSPVLHDNDGDHSDDVISIEGGDLENEMSEHLDEDASSKQSGQSAAVPSTIRTNSNNENDIVSLDSSEDDDDEAKDERISESWQSRYMRSSKVHKVLAVSRLGKRVRDKLKTTKRSKKDSNSDKSSSKDERGKSSKYTSKHEDGSIDQYKELIQMSQRKN